MSSEAIPASIARAMEEHTIRAADVLSGDVIRFKMAGEDRLVCQAPWRDNTDRALVWLETRVRGNSPDGPQRRKLVASAEVFLVAKGTIRQRAEAIAREAAANAVRFTAESEAKIVLAGDAASGPIRRELQALDVGGVVQAGVRMLGDLCKVDEEISGDGGWPADCWLSYLARDGDTDEERGKGSYTGLVTIYAGDAGPFVDLSPDDAEREGYRLLALAHAARKWPR